MDNASVIVGSPAGAGEIVYDRAKKVFLTHSNGRYYSNIVNSDNYGNSTEDGIKPKEGVIFYHRTSSDIFTFKDGELKALSSASGTVDTSAIEKKADDAKKVADTAKQVAEEAKRQANTNKQAIETMVISGGVPIVQELGNSETRVMSQKAVTIAIEKTKEKIVEVTQINALSLQWKRGGIKKSDGKEESAENEFIFSQDLSVEGFNSIEFEYQTYSTYYVTVLYSAGGDILQVFGVDKKGENGIYSSTNIDLPPNASYIKFTSYIDKFPNIFLKRNLSLKEKSTVLEKKIEDINEGTKSLFTRDLTNLIRYNTGGINVTNGEFSTNGYDVFAASDFIPIPDDAIKANIGYQAFSTVYGTVVYDAQKKIITSYSSLKQGKKGDVDKTGEIDVPQDAKYIRITGYQPSVNAEKIPLVFILRSANAVSHQELEEKLQGTGIVPPIKSKRLAFCGDSITYGLNQDGGDKLDAFPEQVGRLLGCNTTNYGVSSASVGGEGPRVWSVDFNVVSTEEDIVGIMIGINDFYRGYPLGNKDGSSGFYKDLHAMWKGFISRFPPSRGKRLFCIIYPYYDVKPNWETWTSAMQEVAEYYSIPVLDLSKELGINPHMDTNFEYWREEGAGKHNAHPTQITHDMMAKVVAAYVKAHYDV